LGGNRRLKPRWSRALRFDALHQHDKHFLPRASRWQGNPDPRFQLFDTHCDFQKRVPDGLEGGSSKPRALWRCPAQFEQQPIGAGMQKQPELIGLPAVAGGAV